MATLIFYRIYEAGVSEINLDVLSQSLAHDHSTSRPGFSRVKTKSIIMEIPPLAINLEPYRMESNSSSITLNARAKVYDIGAVSIALIYECPGEISGSLENHVLQFAGQDGLGPVFAHYLNYLHQILKPHIPGISIEPEFYEDYTICLIKHSEECSDPVPVLMGEKGPFSSQIREEVTRNRLSYSPEDYLIISYDTALVCDPEDPSDIADLIEFANVQLLELRYYDRGLTQQMARMYEDLEQADRMPRFRRLRRYHQIMAQLMEAYTEITEVFEKINNLIKITEDIYYAKVYETTLKVLRSQQWTSSVKRKLDVILQNYAMLSNEVNIQHSNFLEWMIIILIALEFAFALWQSLS